jgi:hypothetical protein
MGLQNKHSDFPVTAGLGILTCRRAFTPSNMDAHQVNFLWKRCFRVVRRVTPTLLAQPLA